MKNWVTKKFCEVYDVRDGTHDSPKYVNEGYALITSKNLKNDNLNYDNVNYITEQDYININKRSKVDVGDVLFAMIGTIGNPIVIKTEPDFAIKNVALFKVPINQDSFFLKYYLDSGLVIEQMTKDAKGATQKFVGLGYLRNFEIPLPPLPEQQRIVAILDEAFAAIATVKSYAEQNLKNAKELFESYLQGVFENKGEGWEQTTLKKEIELLVGFAFKSKEYTENKDDILLLRGDNIMQGCFRWEDVKRWKKSEYQDYKKYQLQENDIVLAMDRPWVKAGLKIARLSKNDLPALLVQRTACLRTKSNLDNSFLFHLLKSNKYMNYLLEVQTGIGVPHISGQQISDFIFYRPSLKEQQTIVQKLDTLSVETKKLEAIYTQKLNDLDELKKSVLQKAFSGELKTATALV